MADRPIIFSAPMIHALLDGRKTMTRRVLKPQPKFGFKPWQDEDGSWMQSGYGEAGNDPLDVRYAVGEHLWVRESIIKTPAGIAYAASDQCHYGAGGKLRATPSIHMPRWASRITLTVTAVRVERLQDISEADAIAEGIQCNKTLPEDTHRCWLVLGNNGRTDLLTSWDAKDVFRQLWHHIHGPGAWEANPWCAAISFTFEPRNIDG